MAKIGNYVVGGEEDGTLRFNEDEHCYEEIEHPYVDEEKERRAGFFVPNHLEQQLKDDGLEILLSLNKGEE